jgi:hypothetical protein
MIPLQTIMNQFGGGYFPARQGYGVYQNPSRPTISQNQSFREPWSQIPQPTMTIPVTTSHSGIISPTSASHAGDWSTTSASHVEDQQLVVAGHVGGTNIVTASHTTHTSPTYVIHVGDSSSTSTSDVEGSSPTSASHVGHSSPISASHVGYFLLASAIHAGSMSPTTAIHVGGIHMIEKPKRIRCKPKFLCRICKGYHLTCLCPAIFVVQEVCSLPGVPSGSESSLDSNLSLYDIVVMWMQSSADTTLIFWGDASLDLVFSHLVQPTVMLMQSSTDTTPIFGGDASLDLVVSHPIQPMVEEVVMLMQSSTNPTLLLESENPKGVTFSMQSSINLTLILEGDASFNHVLIISSHVYSQQGSILLSLRMIPPSPRVVSFDWNDLVESQLPSSTPFQIRGILRYIVDKVTSASILSSST